MSMNMQNKELLENVNKQYVKVLENKSKNIDLDHDTVNQSIRRFGDIGPLYQVTSINNDVAEVIYLESGEKSELPVRLVLNDKRLG